jgi:hypothetical protein
LSDAGICSLSRAESAKGVVVIQLVECADLVSATFTVDYVPLIIKPQDVPVPVFDTTFSIHKWP